MQLLGQSAAAWKSLGQSGTVWGRLGQSRTVWDSLGQSEAVWKSPRQPDTLQEIPLCFEVTEHTVLPVELQISERQRQWTPVCPVCQSAFYEQEN